MVNKLHGKVALVTGGAGFLGSHLASTLLKHNWKVKILDNLSSGSMKNIPNFAGVEDELEVIIGDVKDRVLLDKVMHDCDVVFHMAANPEVRVSTVEPRVHFNENVLASFELLESMRKNDVATLVFASSSSVYGDTRGVPVEESQPLRPVSVYGATKCACESLMRVYSNLYGIRVIVLRYANVVGPNSNHGVIYDFVRKLSLNPGELEILGDGNQIRSFVYVEDAISATLLLCERSDGFDVFNIGNSDYLKVIEVADIVKEVLGLSRVKYTFRTSEGKVGWKGDVHCALLSIEKARRFGWMPKFSSGEAVRLTVKSLIGV
jgi:UDP-glucose 4-epimerase